jgi:hypothetical protein
MCNLWVTAKNEHSVMRTLAICVLLPFVTSYLCESAFSSLTYIATKYATRLANVEEDLRAALRDIEPRFDLLCSEMQAHASHQEGKCIHYLHTCRLPLLAFKTVVVVFRVVHLYNN